MIMNLLRIFNLKNWGKLASIGLATVMLVACVDLEIVPKDKYLSGNISDDAASTNYLINNAYAALMGTAGNYGYYGRSFVFLSDLTSDDADYIAGESTSSARLDLDKFSFTPANSHISDIWPNAYNVISACNMVLRDVDKVNNSIGAGQAMFLRAHSYFNLVRVYGGVPLVTKVPITNEDFEKSAVQTRNSINEVYDFIVAELEEVVTNNMLPIKWDGNEKGRATQWAAKTLLAKVYLTSAGPGTEYIVKKNSEWLARSQELLLDIKNNGGFALDEYMTLWQIKYEYSNREVIFDIGNNGIDIALNGSPGRYTTNYMPIDRAGFNPGWGNNIPSLELYNTIDNQDTRKKAYVSSFILKQDLLDAYAGTEKHFDANNVPYIERTSVLTDETKRFYVDNQVDFEYWEFQGSKRIARPHLGKFADRSGTVDPFANLDDHNFKVFRYAEVLLMLAEVNNEINNGPTDVAYEAINEVRRRAYESTAFDIPAGLNYTEFKAAMMLERRKEFFQEAKRWWDLVRWDNFMEVMTANGRNPQLHNRYFPIPQNVLDKNSNIAQNPGY